MHNNKLLLSGMCNAESSVFFNQAFDGVHRAADRPFAAVADGIWQVCFRALHIPKGGQNRTRTDTAALGDGKDGRSLHL